MADIVIPINKTVDISKGTLYTTLGLQNTHDQLIQGQSYANVLNVSVYDGAEPIALSGGCMGYFVRQQDGSTVTVAGTISGNVASVEFPSFVYDYTGLLTITLNVGGTSLVQIATTVRLGATMVVVDPGNVLPNLDEVQQIMLDVESALNQLSSALTASQQATQAANTAAGAANTAAGAANTAAETANTAAAALNGLTATANTLEPGEPATAVAELVSGAWKITLGIPQGVQGIQGVRGTVAWHGTVITGTSTTPTAYPTGIDSAIAGDLYLYSGTDVANIGNVYTCTQGGDASTALWAYMANWRGATGAGSVSSVNSVLPNTDGDVELTAADVGARPDTWTPTAADVGARPDTWTPDGLIYETTAQALEALSQEQRAALYEQGYRAIKTTNNETVVLLGLESDGSLSWIGCNQDAKNLLDNPNFAIAQAGYGGTHGTQVYAADRWIGSGTGATFAAGSTGGLVITCGTDAASVEQVIADPPAEGEHFSFIVVSGEDVLVASGTWTGTAQDATATAGTLTAAVNSGSAQISVSSGSATVGYCMLLKGSYTKKTAPPFEDLGEVSALSDCLYFFRKRGFANSAGIGASASQIRAFVDFTANPMRIGPTTTVMQASAVISSQWVEASSVTIVGTQSDGVVIGMNFDTGGVTANASYLVRFAADFSSDL